MIKKWFVENSNLILTFFSGGFFGVILIALIAMSATYPTAYFSISKGGACVKVKNADPKYNCENLPPKYDFKWVK